jgi:serralysin
VLTGNDADNRLKGGRGADKLRGGGGADIFVYDKASESTPQNPDLIEDFTSGTDKVDVSGALREAGSNTSTSPVNSMGSQAMPCWVMTRVRGVAVWRLI